MKTVDLEVPVANITDGISAVGKCYRTFVLLMSPLDRLPLTDPETWPHLSAQHSRQASMLAAFSRRYFVKLSLKSRIGKLILT